MPFYLFFAFIIFNLFLYSNPRSPQSSFWEQASCVFRIFPCFFCDSFLNVCCLVCRKCWNFERFFFVEPDELVYNCTDSCIYRCTPFILHIARLFTLFIPLIINHVLPYCLVNKLVNFTFICWWKCAISNFSLQFCNRITVTNIGAFFSLLFVLSSIFAVGLPCKKPPSETNSKFGLQKFLFMGFQKKRVMWKKINLHFFMKHYFFLVSEETTSPQASFRIF